MSRLTYSQAYRDGLREEMLRDPSIFLLGTDLFDRGGHFAQATGLGSEFGRERVMDAPISEAAMVAAGVGAAINGMRPVVDLNFIDFVFGAMDEVVNQAAKTRYMFGRPVPLVIRATSGVALYAAQHNNSVEAWFAHVPGLLIAMPATANDAKGLIKSALRGEDPVIFLMHKRLTGTRGEAGGPDDLVPFGEASVVRSGSDVTIVAWSGMVAKAVAAADELGKGGVSAEVIDLRTIVPFDAATVEESVARTGRLVVATEEPRFGSFAAEVVAHVHETVGEALVAPAIRLGALHAPIPHSPVLTEHVIPQVGDIVAAATELAAR